MSRPRGAGAPIRLLFVVVVCLMSLVGTHRMSSGVGAAPLLAGEAPTYLRGDANSSGDVDLSDAIFLLQFLFLGGPEPLCEGLGDANGRNGTDIADAVFLLQVLFSSGSVLSPLTEEEIADCDEQAFLREGETEYATASADGNAYACAHCHSRGEAGAFLGGDITSETARRAAYGLGDVLRRESWFGTQIVDLREAVNRCRDDWMEAPPLAEEDRAWQALRAWLESIDPNPDEPAPLVPIEIVAPMATGPSEGDPENGCAIFAAACQTCHGLSEAGTPLADALWDAILTPDEFRRAVRLSGPTAASVPGTLYEGLLGNSMPFFGPDRLSDSDLEDVLAYWSIARDPERRECDDVGVQPPSLLRAANFRTILHGVRGRAEHWSDRTIRLRQFNYDGRGPEFVYVWLYQKSDDVHAILRGYPISGHMGRERPYTNVELSFEIPEHITDDMFNTVAIWCTAFQSNYGDAELEGN